MLWALLCLVSTACERSPEPEGRALRFWHTFNASESRALEAWLAQRSELHVATTVVPFARAAWRFRAGLDSERCPDLLRIDATRLVELAQKEQIAEVSREVWRKRQWLPEAAELVTYGERRFGIPHSLDGLALIRWRDDPRDAPPNRLGELETWLGSGRGRRLGLLIDGYWFVPYLRAAGARLPALGSDLQIDQPRVTAALERFAGLFHRGLAVDLLDSRDRSRSLHRHFRDREVSVVVNGPWALAELAAGSLESLEVTPFPEGLAPRGGQVLAVPTCAREPGRAWALAIALTAPEVQARWANALGLIPTTAEALSKSGRVPREFYRALQAARPLPRHSAVPELFDDLTPAVRAVVGRDATASEALAGVQRSWKRLYQRRGIAFPKDAGGTGGDAR